MTKFMFGLYYMILEANTSILDLMADKDTGAVFNKRVLTRDMIPRFIPAYEYLMNTKMNNFFYYLYFYALVHNIRLKKLYVCESIDPNMPPDPPLLEKKFFKLSGDKSCMVGKYDDVTMGCNLKKYFKTGE